MRLNRSHYTSCIAIATAALSFTVAPAAFAQNETAAEQQGLGEIVVTAQRREENLQDVPLSVTAVSGDKLDRLLQKPLSCSHITAFT